MNFNDKTATGAIDTDGMGIQTVGDDYLKVQMTGHITDRVFDLKGNLIEERVGHNLVVNSMVPLIMSLFKKQANYSGLSYWAVGSGATAWDTTLPNPTMTEVKLTNEIGRVAITPAEMVYLTPTYEVSATPTNSIQISHTFGANDCNGIWREFGIFGGTANNTANSGVMVNKRHHKVITKTEEMVVERVMRFTITLV